MLKLQLALISPLMPTYQVCQSNTISAQLHQVFIEYEANRSALVFKESTLPHISGNNYIHSISLASLQRFQQAQQLGSFNSETTIQPDSTAISVVLSNSTSILARNCGSMTVTTLSCADQCVRFLGDVPTMPYPHSDSSASGQVAPVWSPNSSTSMGLQWEGVWNGADSGGEHVLKAGNRAIYSHGCLIMAQVVTGYSCTCPTCALARATAGALLVLRADLLAPPPSPQQMAPVYQFTQTGPVVRIGVPRGSTQMRTTLYLLHQCLFPLFCARIADHGNTPPPRDVWNAEQLHHYFDYGTRNGPNPQDQPTMAQVAFKCATLAQQWRKLSGQHQHKIYAPFVAQGGNDRPEFLSWCQVETDVSKVVNKTTLGLYSICLFADQVWSGQRTENKLLPHHLSFTTGNTRCKRPRAEAIAKSGAPPKRQKVNMVKGMKIIWTSIKGGRPDRWHARPSAVQIEDHSCSEKP
ncbi:hypothetical protein DFH08DRAFT_804844 [Mycena albidolilacea]|uniref:Uncharacterized protein n=1 Tax=Mycena albidolilacea TaxID=1033008 RepID=A0AAD7AA26_9AGAR|nr:hypothetical protein DFH08DRAFT_804844 [Mycena albidolilacea]